MHLPIDLLFIYSRSGTTGYITQTSSRIRGAMQRAIVEANFLSWASSKKPVRANSAAGAMEFGYMASSYDSGISRMATSSSDLFNPVSLWQKSTLIYQQESTSGRHRSVDRLAVKIENASAGCEKYVCKRLHPESIPFPSQCLPAVISSEFTSIAYTHGISFVRYKRENPGQYPYYCQAKHQIIKARIISPNPLGNISEIHTSHWIYQ